MSLLPLAVALAVAASSPAYPSRMEPAFSSTVVSTYPDGRHGELWLERDGSWRGISRHGTRSSGKWQVKGERLCLRQSRPFPVPFAYCTPVPHAEGGPGASWSAKAPTGEPITVQLVAGRAGEPEA